MTGEFPPLKMSIGHGWRYPEHKLFAKSIKWK